jgi:hypothetical protein|tara:strand:+ start:282 stop:548 length:267 start_codon:yes stop_codon:yes gene_type:complete
MGFSFVLCRLVYAFAYQSYTASWRIIVKKASITVLIVFVLILSACQPPPIDPMKVKILSLDTEQQIQSYAYSMKYLKMLKAANLKLPI